MQNQIRNIGHVFHEILTNNAHDALDAVSAAIKKELQGKEINALDVIRPHLIQIEDALSNFRKTYFDSSATDENNKPA